MGFAVDAGIGALLAWGFVALARRAGRGELAWIAAGLIAAGVLYPLMGLATRAVGDMPIEILGALIFSVAACLGVLVSPWFLAVGWGFHALWDLLLPALADTAYAPVWYAAACLGFDLVVAGAVAVRARRSQHATGIRTAAA